jgi:hypothetical protein
MDIAAKAAACGVSPDEYRERFLTLRVAIWKSDFRRFAREVIRIRTKNGDLEPLVLNSAQEILHTAAEAQLADERWVRLMGLKGRRQGFSTMVAARAYWRTTLWDRQRAYILSHEMASSNTLFDMTALMQEKHPFPPQVGTDNAKELEFVKRGSSYTVATAGQKAGGRGGAVTFFHGSEAAWWTNAEDHFSSSVQSVDEVRGVWGIIWKEPANPLPFEEGLGEIWGWVKAPSEIWLETTSAGPMGSFFRRYNEAMQRIGRYRHVFVPWIVQAEYTEEGDFVPYSEPEEEGDLSEIEYQELHGLTDGQMLWRRSKTRELGSAGKFRQEYPIDITEAFASADTDAFIKPALVLRARKRKFETPDAPLIVGVDPAGSGGDRFAVAWRRGDMIIRIEHRNKLEHDEAVAWLSKIIDEDKPNRMCVDRGSMGQNIVSALRNMNKRYADIVKGIDFGGTSRFKMATPKRAGPWNRRAEMYGDFKDWLTDGGAIPDDDDLASDISGPKQKWRANNDWLLESKTEMKARQIRSSDLSDACVLTFATREFFDTWSKPEQPAGFGAGRDPRDSIGGNGGPKLIDNTGSAWEAPDADSSGGYGWMA